MNFVSIRIITDDVARLVAFYEQASGLPATRYTEDFAELATPSATVAIAGTRTVPPGFAQPGTNRNVIVEFLVEDVDALHRTLTGVLDELPDEPRTMPWGNRSLVVRDPDGNLVNFFTPVTPAARQKFGL